MHDAEPRYTEQVESLELWLGGAFSVVHNVLLWGQCGTALPKSGSGVRAFCNKPA